MKVSPGRSRPTKYSSISPSIGPRRTALADQPDLDHRRCHDRADVHAMPQRHALRSHMHQPQTVAKQFSPLVISFQRVAAVFDKPQHVVEHLACQVGIRRRTPHLGINVIRAERCGACEPKQMLRQHIQSARPRRIAVEFLLGHTLDRCLTFQHLEPIGRHQDGLARLIHPVIGAAHALQQPGHAFRRTDLDHLIDAAPIDAKIQRRRGHHGAQPAGGHRGFDLAPLLDLQAAVVQTDRHHRIVQLPQRLKHQFRLGARIDEHDRHVARHECAPSPEALPPAPCGRPRTAAPRAA